MTVEKIKVRPCSYCPPGNISAAFTASYISHYDGQAFKPRSALIATDRALPSLTILSTSCLMYTVIVLSAQHL